MASTYLTKSMSGNTPSKKMTFSAWIKKSYLTASGFSSRLFGTRNANHVYIHTEYVYFDVTNTSDSWLGGILTNAKLRDTNGWYHIVASLDTTLSTATDRQKIYINGERQSVTINKQIAQDDISDFGANGVEYSVGGRTSAQGGAGGYFDGLMSHVHYCDGYAYDASDFGETDTTTGIWKPKTAPSVTYGTNGFFLKFENSAAMDTDSSGNSNTFAVNGTMTQLIDTPSNVFATMNPLGTYDGTLSNGNTRVKTNQTNYRYIASTLGVSSGRYYWECKLQEIGNYMLSGITDQPSFPASGVTMLGNGTYDCAVYVGNQSASGGNGHLYHSSTSNASNTNTPGSFMSAFSQGDILTFALDLDSSTRKLYIGANGQWANGSGSTNQTFANATGVSIVIPQNTNTGFYFPACGDYSGTYGHWEYNFGNGYFGTTAVSSAQNPDDGIGIFEYDVPAGYRALCTKSINAQEYS
jgi:hypothetical protein